MRVSVFEKVGAVAGGAPRTDTRFILQALHLLGAFLNCLSRKNSCSPAVKRKSTPQSMQVNVLSWNSIEKKLPSFWSAFVPHAPRQSGLFARGSAQLDASPSIVVKTTLDSARHALRAWILETAKLCCDNFAGV